MCLHYNVRDHLCKRYAHFSNIPVQFDTIVIALQHFIYKVMDIAGKSIFLTINWSLPMHDCSIGDMPIISEGFKGKFQHSSQPYRPPLKLLTHGIRYSVYIYTYVLGKRRRVNSLIHKTFRDKVKIAIQLSNQIYTFISEK